MQSSYIEQVILDFNVLRRSFCEVFVYAVIILSQVSMHAQQIASLSLIITQLIDQLIIDHTVY